MCVLKCHLLLYSVALFTRAWIEIDISPFESYTLSVALFTRAWIEISSLRTYIRSATGRPLYEGVD